MATQSPFSIPEPFLKGLAAMADKAVELIRLPLWLVHEAQQRVVLLLNHVLMQEPEAMARLARQAGRTLEARWQHYQVQLLITKAGLFDVPAKAVATSDGAEQVLVPADLVISLQDVSIGPILGAVLQGEKPSIKIEGDVQLAAEINWLVDNVRWDIEEDLSRIIGDVPAHKLVSGLRSAWSRRPK
jgi:ubiquinone biosynthesis accessory factor UbiJ